ncbi:MAG: hypothetical protein PHH60_06215, partial [Candidatus Margulisbacteria bacterium]|nr:hypothetical protein [Candidatus Margulisiibacteriota bacterium]
LEQFGGRPAFNRALADANLRYRMAQDSLTDLTAVIELASRYQDIDLSSDNLSDQDRAFIQACRDAADRFRPVVENILSEILDEQSGLMLLDIRSYRHSLVEYQHALQGNNQRKQSEALDRFSGQAYRILSILRRWENSSRQDPALYQTLSTYSQNLGNRLRAEVTNMFPAADSQRLQQQLSMIDQVVLTQIEGDRSVESLSLDQVRARYSRAQQLSDTLGSGPARDLIVSFLQDSLRERDFADIDRLFSFFNGVSNMSTLETDCQNILRNNVFESFGLSGGASGNTTARAYLANNMVGRSMDSTLNRTMQLAANLYYLIQQYNQYANSDAGRTAGATPLTFSDIIGSAREVLAGMRNADGTYVSVSEANSLLRILSRTSDNADIARIEIAQQRDEALNNFYLRDSRRLLGGNEITFTPRAIRELEGDFTQNVTPGGLISYEDIQRWASPELLATLPLDAQTGDWFYMSIDGIQRVTADQLATLESLPRIPVNNLEGTEYERTPENFLRNERLAVLKLAIARYGAVSDEQVLMMHGAVTARLTAVDLLGSVRVFGEGSAWTFRPGSLQLNQEQGAAVRTLAEIIETGTTFPAGSCLSSYSAAERSDLAQSLRRAASGEADVRFTAEQRDLLLEFLSDFPDADPEEYSYGTEDAYTAEFSRYFSDNVHSLSEHDPFDVNALASAVGDLREAVGGMRHKLGLSRDRNAEHNTAVLEDLAGYLAWADELPENDPLRRAIAIYDSRLTDEEPSPELVAALREAAQRLGHEFDEQAFTITYGRAVDTLRYLHRTLVILASKYPAETRGWEGLGDLVLHHYTEEIPQAATGAIQAPGQADYLMSGVSNDVIFMINMLIYSEPGENNDIVDELEQINARIEELRADLGV